MMLRVEEDALELSGGMIADVRTEVYFHFDEEEADPLVIRSVTVAYAVVAPDERPEEGRAPTVAEIREVVRRIEAIVRTPKVRRLFEREAQEVEAMRTMTADDSIVF